MVFFLFLLLYYCTYYDYTYYLAVVAATCNPGKTRTHLIAVLISCRLVPLLDHVLRPDCRDDMSVVDAAKARVVGSCLLPLRVAHVFERLRRRYMRAIVSSHFRSDLKGESSSDIGVVFPGRHTRENVKQLYVASLLVATNVGVDVWGG